MTQTSSNKREFKPVAGGGGTQWNPQMTEANFMKMGSDNIKMGYLLNVAQRNGTYGLFNVYAIQVVNDDDTFGPIIEVKEDTVLAKKFAEVPFGSFIQIEYKGKVHKPEIKKAPGYHPEAPFSKTNSYHMWEVGVDPNAMPYAQAKDKFGKASVAAPANNTVQNTTNNNNSETFSEDDDQLPF